MSYSLLRRIFVTLVLGVAMAACRPAAPIQATIPATQTPIEWPLPIEGTRLELIDEKNILIYSFGQNGLVAVTAGTKGMVTGPLMYWWLDGREMHIGIRQGDSSSKLHLLKTNTEEWTVQIVGESSASRFRYARYQKP